jgi:hypothetical protein
MLDNSTLTLLLGVTMLFTAIIGIIVGKLINRISHLEDELNAHKHQNHIALSDKTIDIYDTISKSITGIQNAVNENNSKLIDVTWSRFDSIDLRIDRIEKDIIQPKKVAKPRKPKAPKDEMLKS